MEGVMMSPFNGPSAPLLCFLVSWVNPSTIARFPICAFSPGDWGHQLDFLSFQHSPRWPENGTIEVGHLFSEQLTWVACCYSAPCSKYVNSQSYPPYEEIVYFLAAAFALSICLRLKPTVIVVDWDDPAGLQVQYCISNANLARKRSKLWTASVPEVSKISFPLLEANFPNREIIK